MKKQFKMEQSEMDAILEINKNKSPVMKIGTYISGLDLQDNINSYWKKLGDKYGFDERTVEPSSEGTLFFLAVGKEKVIPKTQLEIAMDEFNSIKKIVDQLKSCEYENQAGPLKNNIAFMALERMAK